MGHPNPRFLAVARRVQPRPARDAEPQAGRAKKKGVGTGWKVAALVAGAGVLLWTLSGPRRDREDERGGSDEGQDADETRALPPSRGEVSATSQAAPDERSTAVASPLEGKG